MANFAQLDADNNVIQVLEVDESVCRDVFGVRSEEIAVGSLKKVYGSNTKWKETSLYGSIRGVYAAIGYKYYPEVDLFAPLQPYPSWSLSTETGRWESPIERPSPTEEEVSLRKSYQWDEEAYQADNTTGWVLQDYPS